MRFRRVILATGVMLSAATFATPAVATPTVVDQYTEQVPNPGGESPGHVGKPGGETVSSNSVNGSGRSNGSGPMVADPGVPAATSESAPGSAPAVNKEESSKEESSGSSGSPTSRSGGRPRGADSALGDAAPPGGVPTTEAPGSSSSMGVPFSPALLLMSGATVAVVLMRRRSSARPQAGQMRVIRHLTLAAAGVAALIICLSGASPASAARPFETGVTTPDVTAPEQVSFDRIKSAGAELTRVVLFWRLIAPQEEPESWDPTDPEDPNYNWDSVDDSVTFADNAGLTVLASIYQAPEWAERCKSDIEGICNPDPAMFADFAEAAAKRYSGDTLALPRIRFWKPWNEPNLFIFFLPQFKQGKKVSPDLYRTMANQFASRIRGVDPSNRIVGGGLAPLQRPGGVGPLDFMRRVLCLKGRSKPTKIPGCTAKTRFDIWANNPYTTGGPTHESAGKDDVSLGDLPQVPKVLKAAMKYNRIVTSSKRIPLWVTEFSWDSKGPDPGGVKMSILKKWVPEAMHQAWKAGVSKFFWLSLRDWPREEGLPYSQTYEAGLYFRGATVQQDKAKPFLGAFRFPFTAYKGAKGLRVWGRTPDASAARVKITYRFKDGWRKVGIVKAAGNGVFSKLLKTRLVKKNKGQARARLIGLGSGQRQSLNFPLKPIKDFRQPPFG